MNITQRATQAARLIHANRNHCPVVDGNPYEHRAWCADNLLHTIDVGLPTNRAVLAFLTADANCDVPVLQSVFDRDTREDQLALAL